ncbi:MAG: hypothetical protein ABI867_14420 [Kofleriaceae bacterium]
MRLIATLVLSFAVPAAADPAPAKPAAAPAASACKKVIVGKGADRKIVCEITAPVVVKAGAPKPEVLIVPQDGRKVVGRPRSENRLNGLSPRR